MSNETAMQDPTHDGTMLRFACPACAQSLAFPAQLAGINGPCPHCQTLIVSPNPSVGQPARVQNLSGPGEFAPAPSAQQGAPNPQQGIPEPRHPIPPSQGQARIVEEPGHQQKPQTQLPKSRSNQPLERPESSVNPTPPRKKRRSSTSGKLRLRAHIPFGEKTFNCPGCEMQLDAPTKPGIQKGKCPQCETTIEIVPLAKGAKIPVVPEGASLDITPRRVANPRHSQNTEAENPQQPDATSSAPKPASHYAPPSEPTQQSVPPNDVPAPTQASDYALTPQQQPAPTQHPDALSTAPEVSRAPREISEPKQEEPSPPEKKPLPAARSMEPLIKEKAEGSPETQPQRVPHQAPPKDEGPGFPHWLRWCFNLIGLLILGGIVYFVAMKPPVEIMSGNNDADDVAQEMDRMSEVREDSEEVARGTARKYFSSITWQDSLSYAINKPLAEVVLGKYYKEHAWAPLPLQGSDLKLVTSKRIPGSELFITTFVATIDDRPDLPVAIEETSNGLKIHWELTHQLAASTLSDFREQKGDKEGRFYIEMKGNYFPGEEIPSISDKWLEFDAFGPYTTHTPVPFKVRVLNGSPLTDPLLRKIRSDKWRKTVVTLQWVKENDEEFIELVGMHRSNWSVFYP